jgi:hypothetical protein
MERAKLMKGEIVLINGAIGVSGRLGYRWQSTLELGGL